jgi:N-acetylmuramic acid 6-phosphate etherase
MLMQLTDKDRATVRAALRQANGSVKLAVLLLQGCTLDEAHAALDDADGQLRGALRSVQDRNADPEG